MNHSYSCPVQIYGTLKSVKGQSSAKRALCSVLFEQIKKIDSQNDEAIKYKSTNITLVGPSGCGKTFLVETACKAVGLPFHIINAPKLGPHHTSDKYSLEKALEEYYEKNKANPYDHHQLCHGVIFVDEVDKLGCMIGGNNPNWGTQIQDAMLRLMEGSELTVDGITYNTADLLFVFAGAFTGIEKHIENRLSKENLKSTSIGFARKTSGQSKEVTDTKDLRKMIELDDLVSYNLKPEFVGRLGVLIPMESTNENTVREIIKERVKKGVPYFKNEGVQLHFTEESIDSITNKCMKKKTFGYRGIGTFLEKLLNDPKFHIGKLRGKTISITGKIVDEGFSKNYFDNLTPKSSQTKEVQEHKEKADAVNPYIENEKYDTVIGVIHSVHSPIPNIDNAFFLDLKIETSIPNNPNKKILFPVRIWYKELIIDFTKQFLGDHTEDLSSDFPDNPNLRYVIKEENSNRTIIKMDKKINIKMKVHYQQFKTVPDKFFVSEFDEHSFDEVQELLLTEEEKNEIRIINLYSGNILIFDEKDENGFYKWSYQQISNYQSIS